MNNNNQCNRAGAFTVVELLAVLVVVALLVATRLSVLSHTKNRSQDVIDFYNNKQLMLAAIMYAADQSDTLPGCGLGTAHDAWAYAGGIPTYGYASPTTFASYYSNQVNYLRLGQLFPYAKTEKIFLCPADKPNSLYYQRNIYITSYVWNGAVGGYGSLTTPNGLGSYKVAQFKPNAIVQWEADDSTPFYWNDASSFPDEGVSGRHGNGTTVGLISGGIQRIPINLWFTSRYAGASGTRGAKIPAAQLPNQFWCNPGTRRGLAN